MVKRFLHGSIAREYLLTAAAAVGLALFIRFFIVEVYRLPAGSMNPTLLSGDTVFVSKWPYGLRIPGTTFRIVPGGNPSRGEVVVFWMPGDFGRDVIKRVIGVPGDRVAVSGGRVILNGQALPVQFDGGLTCGTERIPELKEPYGICIGSPTLPDYAEEKVPEGKVFVLGDDRSEKQLGVDGRPGLTWGMIPAENLTARVSRVWISVEPRSGERDNRRWWSRLRRERTLKGVH